MLESERREVDKREAIGVRGGWSGRTEDPRTEAETWEVEFVDVMLETA